MDFKKINNYTGWALFAIAAIVYLSTMERSVSLWDCGEYIATSNKLEVGHPPGAPTFMMINRLVSAFVPAESVALVINAVSALCSAFTILFLYWTITMLGEKVARTYYVYEGDGKLTDEQKLAASQTGLFGRLFAKGVNSARSASKSENNEITEGQRWAIIGSGIVGALVYTFTDSFWFSAVEAEVYAMSSFFTAVTFWAIFKWEKDVDKHEAGESKRNPDYWLVFIMFMIGLSIGVHLLNLLAIPAIAYVYYFKKFKQTSLVGFLVAGVAGLVALVLVQNIIIPKTVSWASGFEIYFTNSMGMPFGTGTMLYFALLFGAIIAGLWYSRKKALTNLNTGLLSLAVLYIGYSSFAMIPIRSNANPPIDENNPENLVSLNQYLLREQYGDWPLLKGPQFNSVEDNVSEYGDKTPVHIRRFVVVKGDKDIEGFRSEETAKKYIADRGIQGAEIVEKYYVSDDRKNTVPVYQEGHTVVFPRMYSPDPKHIEQYKKWSGYPANPKADPNREPVPARTVNGIEQIYLPTSGENFTYFLNYQIDHMFWRYFMWNFSGRQNDDHNQNGDVTIGNWQTGLNFIDSQMLGDQSKLPEHRASNYANNKYYLLPLLLGLIGFFYQLHRNWKDWFVVLLLFLFTGFMIIIYLNQKPLEPRERDYAYAAAFYTFAIWIGLSVYAIYDLVRSLDWKGLARTMVYPLGAGVFFLLVETVNGGTHVLSYSLMYMTLVATAVIALFMLLKDTLKDHKKQAIAITGLTLFVPLLMAFQNWNDHDRSGRYAPREMAKNYLKPCAKQAIVFTNGDNDTFPLWYIQEVEGFRTDIRTVNLSLANTDWYIDQMKRKAYDSEPLPISFEEHQFRSGAHLDIAYLPSQVVNLYYGAFRAQQERGKPIPPALQEALNYVAHYTPSELKPLVDAGIPVGGAKSIYNKAVAGGDKHMDLKQVMENLRKGNWIFPHPVIAGKEVTYVPAKAFKVPVDKQKVIESGAIPASKQDQIVDELTFALGKSYILKADMLILDLLANSEWERPIYFAATAGRGTYLGLHPYFQLEGLVYRVVPVRTESKYQRFNIYGSVHTEKMYALAVGDGDYDGPDPIEAWDWGNMKGESIYVDYYNRRPVSNFRLQYNVLASELLNEKKPEKALNTLNKSLQEFPDSKIPFDSYVSYYVQSYLKAANQLDEKGEKALAAEAREKARFITNRLSKYFKDDMVYFTSMNYKQFASDESPDDVAYQIYQSFIVLDDLIEFNQIDKDKENAQPIIEMLKAQKVQQKEDFLNKLNTEITKAVNDLEEEDLADAVSTMTNRLYTNLAELFINDAIQSVQREMMSQGDQFNDSIAIQAMQGVQAMVQQYDALYKQIERRAQQKANSSDPQTQQEGQRTLQLFNYIRQ